jgi:hypothetical protein
MAFEISSKPGVRTKQPKAPMPSTRSIVKPTASCQGRFMSNIETANTIAPTMAALIDQWRTKNAAISLASFAMTSSIWPLTLAYLTSSGNRASIIERR